MKPEPPAILVWKGRTIDLDYKPDGPMVTTLLGAVTYSRKRDQLALYDNAGRKWRCTGVSIASGPVTWMHHIATFLFINPCRPCVLEWGDPIAYEFADLAGIARREIEDDDDIITQFHSKGDCLNLVARVRSVKELLSAMRKLRR